MGTLYDLRMQVDKAIETRNLDRISTRGAVGLEAGFLLSLVGPSTPDDPGKIEALRKAASKILQMNF